MDFGFRVIIAESFADIFYSNSFKNGLLLIKLSQDKIEEIIKNVKKEIIKFLLIWKVKK